MFGDLKKQIQEIVKIVDGVPDKFQERCFEILLTAALKEQSKTPPDNESASQNQDSEKPEIKSGSDINALKIPARVRTFMSRCSIPEDMIKGLLFADGEEVLFVQEPDTNKISKGQVSWSLLLALKSAISGNDFQIDPEDVRSVCIEKGLYDKSNFIANFKNNKDLYNKIPAAQGGPVKLSQKGEKRLAELIKELMSRVQQ